MIIRNRAQIERISLTGLRNQKLDFGLSAQGELRGDILKGGSHEKRSTYLHKVPLKFLANSNYEYAGQDSKERSVECTAGYKKLSRNVNR